MNISKSMVRIILLVLAFQLSITDVFASHFSSEGVDSPIFMNIWGNMSMNEANLEIGDEIAACDSNNKILAVFEQTEDIDMFTMTLPGDDMFTQSNDEGFSTNERIIFKMYDKSEDYEFELESNMVSGHSVFLQGIIPTLEPSFTPDGYVKFQDHSAYYYGIHIEGAYAKAPVIDSIVPDEIFSKGGIPLTITGQNFDSQLTLTIDNEPIIPTNISNNQILLIAPENKQITQVILVVTNSDGKSDAEYLTYIHNPPIIDKISPAEGSTEGLTVTIIGDYFREGATVSVGDIAVPATVISSTTIQCFFPPYPDEQQVSVIVKNIDDDNQANSTFRYRMIPKITEITPATVYTTGGEVVQIKGVNFQESPQVTFNDINAFCSRESEILITCTVPQSETTGEAVVLVKNPNSYTAVNTVTYVVPLPEITEIIPQVQYTSGGDILQIKGTNFSLNASVTIDGTIAPNTTFISSQLITCTVLAHDIGPAELLLSNPDGKSATYTLNYAYDPPVISQISPQTGSTDGIETMTISGNYFRPGARVFIAGLSANIQSITTTSIVCDIPGYTAAKSVDVMVVNDDDANDTLENAFTYSYYPKIQTIYPLQSMITGGGTLQITGNHFQEDVSVSFGSITATATRNSYTQITCDIPAHEAGDINIVVKNPDNKTASIQFTYIAPVPTITQISPETVYISGGMTLSITGTSFQNGLTVTVDGVVVPDRARISSTSLTCTVPPALDIGPAILMLTNPDGKSVTYILNYAYDPPVISQISPQSGSTNGFENMTISGNYFRPGVSVTIAGVTANILTNTTTTIVCEIPAYTAAGSVDVVVTNDDDANDTLENTFTYIYYPVIQTIYPQQAMITGGGTLQITGNHFQDDVSVFFDSITVTSNRISYTQISCDIPPHDAGDITIVVKNPDNKTATIQFTYLTPAPTITQISPKTVYIAGGVTVSITGTSFHEDLTVTVDGVLISDRIRSSSTSLTCTVPAHDLGVAVLMLINPDGKSVTHTLNYENNPPVIANVSPHHGSSVGNEKMTITGDYFDLSATVTIDGKVAAIQSITTTSIECNIPSYTNVTCSDSSVNIIVENTDGKQSFAIYQYVFIPKIESISPQIADTTGGGKLTISGLNFQDNATVLIDNAEPENVSIVSHTQIICDIPVHDVGNVNIIVMNPNNYSSTYVLPYEFPAPTITSITPSTVLNSGGTELTIIGTNFDLSATVTIDGVTIANNRMSYTTITCIAPPHEIPDGKISSKVNVVIINPNGKFATDLLTYEFNPPTITNVSPAIGTSNSLTFTVYGDYFREGAAVVVGQNIGNVISLTSKTILCNVIDYEENNLEIKVVNSDSKSDLKIFALNFLPLIQSISPKVVYTTQMPVDVPITITGAHFETGLTVTMAGSIITDLTNTDTTITFNAPLFNGYTKTDITVINPDKTLSTKKEAFEFRDVKADFVVSPNPTGKVPYRVLFEDRSNGKISNIKKWIWQYTEGQSKSTYSNIFPYQYNNTGTYQVKMSVVVFSNGQTYTETAAIQTVNVERQEIALAFETIGGQVGHPPFSIELDNQTTHADNWDITWTWDFGDGNTSNEESPKHTYTQAGNYTITLRAEYNDETKIFPKINYISVIEPKPDNRITGRVSFDNDNQLPDNTWVHVWSTETGNGTSVPVDENGYYTVVDLDPAGEYIISVDFKFGQAYYNDTTVYSSSQAVPVTPSDGYNITLHSHFYSASGKLIFENGQPVSNIMIEAFSDETGYWTFAISNKRFSDNANYKLNELISGTYTIRVISEKFTLKGDGAPITIVVNDVNSHVSIPDLILHRETRSISGEISGVENLSIIWISAFSQSVDFAKAISLTVSGTKQYTIHDLKPADDYVVQLHAQAYPDIYYNSKSSWFEADYVKTSTANAKGIDFTLTSYNRSISGIISVPENAQQGEVIWIDAFSESLQINSAATITVDLQCSASGDCDYPYTISGLMAGDDYVVVVNSDIYETLFYDNQQSMKDAEPIDLSQGNRTGINFQLIEGNFIDGTIIIPDNVAYSDIEVEVWSNNSNSWGFAIPDENGYFSIEGLSQASDFIVQAIIEDEPPYIYKDGAKHTRDKTDATQVASVYAGSTSVNIEIVTGFSISGSVKNETGDSLPNVIVMVENQSENINIVTRTNSYGEYSIMGLPGNNSYNITADPNESSSLRTKTKTIQAYNFTQNSTINFELTSGCRVTGYVKSGGTNINGADIFLRSPVTGYDQWTLTKSGKFVINGVPENNHYELIVETDLNYERILKEISVASDITLNISLSEAAGMISGTVNNDNGEPLPNVMIHIYSIEKEFQRFDIMTNAKGKYEINGLPSANDYVVTAIPETYSYAKETQYEKSPGSTVDFTLTSGGAISGEIQSSDGTKLEGVLVSLNSSSLKIENEMTRTDINGNYTFNSLMNSNDYIITVYPEDYPEPEPLTGLSAGETASFTLTKGLATKVSGSFSNAGSKQIKVYAYHSVTFEIEGQTFVATDGTFEINSLESGTDYILHFVSRDGSVNHFLANDNSLTMEYDETIMPVQTGGSAINVEL
jgi:PKD repeat protein